MAVIDVGQNILLFGTKLFAPPGSPSFPALDLSAVHPNETKIPLLGSGRDVLRLGPIQSHCRFKRLGGAEQQGGRDQTNQSNLFWDWNTLRGFPPIWLQPFLVIFMLLRLLSSFPSRREEYESRACLTALNRSDGKALGTFRRCWHESATTDGLGRLKRTTSLNDL